MIAILCLFGIIVGFATMWYTHTVVDFIEDKTSGNFGFGAFLVVLFIWFCVCVLGIASEVEKVNIEQRHKISVQYNYKEADLETYCRYTDVSLDDLEKNESLRKNFENFVKTGELTINTHHHK